MRFWNKVRKLAKIVMVCIHFLTCFAIQGSDGDYVLISRKRTVGLIAPPTDVLTLSISLTCYLAVHYYKLAESLTWKQLKG